MATSETNLKNWTPCSLHPKRHHPELPKPLHCNSKFQIHFYLEYDRINPNFRKIPTYNGLNPRYPSPPSPTSSRKTNIGALPVLPSHADATYWSHPEAAVASKLQKVREDSKLQ
jgi:hypothetical protein